MSIKKRIVYILIAFSFLLTLLIFYVPTFLSSNWMQKVILSSINGEINGTLEMESMHLSWLGPQRVNGVKLITQREMPVASANFLQIDRSLLASLIFPSNIRNVEIDDLNVEIGEPLIQTLGAKFFPFRLKKSEPIKLIQTNLLLEESQKGLQLVVSGSTEHNKKTGSIQLDVNFSEEKSLVSANITNFPVEVLDVCASFYDPSYYGFFQHVIGDTLNVIVKDITQSQRSSIQLQLESERINFSMNGVVKDKHFQLTTPTTGSLVLNPSTLNELLLSADQMSPFQLVKPLKVDLQINDAEIPIDFFKGIQSPSVSQNMTLNLTIKVPQLEWELDQQKSMVKSLDFQVSAIAGHSSFDLNFNGEYYQEGKSFPFLLKSLHHKPISPEDLILTLVQPQKMSFAFNHLQTKNLDNFFATGNQWQAIFGRTISLHLLSEDNDLQTLIISLNSDYIDIPKMRFKLDQAVILGQDFRSQPISGVLSANQIFFKRENSSLNQFNINWNIDLLKKTIVTDFSGSTQFKDAQIVGDLEGKIYADLADTANPTILFKIKGNQVPAPFVSLVTGRKEWGPIFGPILDFTVDTHLKNISGPIKAEVNGSNGKLNFHGKLSHGILTLNSPLHISTKATPELGKEVLSDFAPVFGQMISADRPISLDIEAEAFSLPLSFNYSQMNFKLATLNLGKMAFHNQGDVNRLLNVLKAGNPSQVEVWATPMYLSMDRGSLTIYRMDMLVLNRYPIATWGGIDLVKDKVNMVLGLSPVALAQSLGITGLPNDYMLQIPVKGSTSNTKINSTMVMSRIGALVAQSSGGPEGLVLGAVLDIANGREPKVPKPTTQPFPWGNLTVSNDQRNNESTNPNPLQGIQKEAKKLIKDIFR